MFYFTFFTWPLVDFFMDIYGYVQVKNIFAFNNIDVKPIGF